MKERNLKQYLSAALLTKSRWFVNLIGPALGRPGNLSQVLTCSQGDPPWNQFFPSLNLWTKTKSRSGSARPLPPSLLPSANEDFDSTLHTNVLVNSSGYCQWLPPGESRWAQVASAGELGLLSGVLLRQCQFGKKCWGGNGSPWALSVTQELDALCHSRQQPSGGLDTGPMQSSLVLQSLGIGLDTAEVSSSLFRWATHPGRVLSRPASFNRSATARW